MLGYRFYIIGPDGHFTTITEFAGKDDAEAVELARRLYSIRIESGQAAHGFEVWQGARRIFSGPKP
jgi:hypothetical protein